MISISSKCKVYDQLIEQVLETMLLEDSHGKVAVIKKKTTKTRKNQYGFNLKEYLKKIAGVTPIVNLKT